MLARGTRRLVETDGRQVEFLPAAQDPGEDVFAHLEFALRKEGLHLELLRKILVKIAPGEVAEYVRDKPTGRYSRVVWWLFETFAGIRLDLPDAQTGNYVDLLDPVLYVTGPTRKVKRQRVNVNLIGTADFAPMVRRKGLGIWNEAEMRQWCGEIVAEYDQALKSFSKPLRRDGGGPV